MRYHEIVLNEDIDTLKRIGANGVLAGALAFGGTQVHSVLNSRERDDRPAVQSALGDPDAEETIEGDPRRFGDGDWFGLKNLIRGDAKPTPEQIQQAQEQAARREDARVLALTMWGEARSHRAAGMRAVGHVVLNRAMANKPSFGEGIKGVATKRKQFSCWNPDDPNRAKLDEIVKLDKLITNMKAPNGQDFDTWYEGYKQTEDFGDYKAWKQAQKIANEILSGQSKDPTRGATFYHTTSITPRWSDPSKLVSQYANHVFYTGAKQAPTKKP